MDANNINFRVYNKNTEQWIHGPGKEVNIFGEHILLGGFLKGTSIEELNDCIVLMDTGLVDKNKKSIYDGDIVQLGISSAYFITRYDYAAGAFIFEERHHNAWCYLKEAHKECVIIGNAFDNHDLLNIQL